LAGEGGEEPPRRGVPGAVLSSRKVSPVEEQADACPEGGVAVAWKVVLLSPVTETATEKPPAPSAVAWATGVPAQVASV
jgi:hypothetical protein